MIDYIFVLIIGINLGWLAHSIFINLQIKKANKKLNDIAKEKILVIQNIQEAAMIELRKRAEIQSQAMRN